MTLVGLLHLTSTSFCRLVVKVLFQNQKVLGSNPRIDIFLGLIFCHHITLVRLLHATSTSLCSPEVRVLSLESDPIQKVTFLCKAGSSDYNL